MWRWMNFVSTPGTSTCRRYPPGRCRSSIQVTVARRRSQSSARSRTRIGWLATHSASSGQRSFVRAARSVKQRTERRTLSRSQSCSSLSIQARRGISLNPITRPPTWPRSTRSAGLARSQVLTQCATSVNRSAISPAAGPRSGRPIAANGSPAASAARNCPDSQRLRSTATTSGGVVQARDAAARTGGACTEPDRPGGGTEPDRPGGGTEPDRPGGGPGPSRLTIGRGRLGRLDRSGERVGDLASPVLLDGERLQPGAVVAWVVDKADSRDVRLDHVDLLQRSDDEQLQAEPVEELEREPGRLVRAAAERLVDHDKPEDPRPGGSPLQLELLGE